MTDDFRNISSSTKVPRDAAEIAGLIRRAADGDFDAYGEIYSLFVAPIYRYVFYQVKNKMMAEDITQDVFVKAWKAIGSCKGREHTFSSWLYRIAHNQTVDVLRRQHKEIPAEMVAVPEATYEEVTETALKRRQLLQAIASLPRNQQQVIILKFVDGFDNSSIGQLMGKSPGAVRILQMRALAALRQCLGRES